MMALADSILAAGDVLAGLAEPCFAADEDLVIRFINPAAAATVGRSVEDALGMRIEERWAAAPDAPFPVACREILAEGGSRRVEQEWAGRCFVTTISRAPAGLVVTYVDVTEQRRAEREAAWMADREAALRRISETVARGAAPHEVLALVAREAAMLTGAHASAVLRFEPGEDETTIMGSWRDGHPEPFDSRAAADAVGPKRHPGRPPYRADAAPGVGHAARHASGAASAAARTWSAPVYALGRLWGSGVARLARVRAASAGRAGGQRLHRAGVARQVASAAARDSLGRSGDAGSAHRAAQPPLLPRATARGVRAARAATPGR
jgi:PAS domain-containing protein